MKRAPNPEMLILARESRSVTQGELAEKTGLNQSSISKFEQGIKEIPDDRVRELADALGYPAAFFYEEGRRYGFGSPHVYHRKQEMPSKQLRALEAITNVRAFEVMRLLKGVEIETDARFHRMDIDEYDSPDEIARITRAMWRLPTGPVQNLMLAVESAGGVVVVCSFGTRKLDALSHWMHGQCPVFFVNKDAPGDRLRFSLAHEIGHVLMHAVASEDPEREADRFAAEFLMPAKEIRGDLQPLTMTKLSSLKYYWKVSMAALIVRTRDLKLITERQYRRFWMQMGQLGYRTREPNPIPREEPSLVHEIVGVYRRNQYSWEELSKVARLHPEEFRQLYSDEPSPLRLVK